MPDDLAVFELTMSMVVHWWQGWFESYPSVPCLLLETVHRILQLEKPDLVQHMAKLGFEVKDYAWPLLRTMFTRVLESEDWQRLLDHLFFNF